MTKLFHPNMRDTAIEVEDDKVESYVAQGWRKTEPKKFKDESPATATTTTTTKSSAPGEDKNKEVSE